MARSEAGAARNLECYGEQTMCCGAPHWASLQKKQTEEARHDKTGAAARAKAARWQRDVARMMSTGTAARQVREGGRERGRGQPCASCHACQSRGTPYQTQSLRIWSARKKLSRSGRSRSFDLRTSPRYTDTPVQDIILVNTLRHVSVRHIAEFLDAQRVGKEQSQSGACKTSLPFTLIRADLVIAACVHLDERGQEFIDIQRAVGPVGFEELHSKGPDSRKEGLESRRHCNDSCSSRLRGRVGILFDQILVPIPCTPPWLASSGDWCPHQRTCGRKMPSLEWIAMIVVVE